MLNVAEAIAERTASPAVDEPVRARLAVVSPATTEAAPPPPLGAPVTFGRTGGQLYPGGGSIAVLMLGAIGYEEMCVRTTWRTLAEHISAAGVACLRFDYPGVGDALDPATPPEGLEDWRETVRAAARYLRHATGREKIAIVGQGLGGALAAEMAEDLGPVEATVFMAPVTSGKLYLRELSLWARMLTDRIGISPDPDDASGHAVAGLALDPMRAAAIRPIDLASLATAPSPRALVVGRVNHGGDERLADRLAALGATVERVAYQGYELLATDPTQARPPLPVIEAVAGWIAALDHETSGAALLTRRTAPFIAAASALQGDGFRELPVRFGDDGRLFGVWCEPDEPTGAPPVIFANSGRDYHIGWARAAVDQARGLARHGVASLRFDAAGLGDSPGRQHADDTLYSQGQIDDLRAAVDWLSDLGHHRVTAVGRCSGAYAAFNAAVQDSRIGHVVMINAERFVWDPHEDLAEALRYAHRSIGDFGATIWKRGGWRRLLRGQLRVSAAGGYVARRVIRNLALRLAPVLGDLTHQGRLRREVHGCFAALAARRVNVALVYSDGDLGLAEVRKHFGENGRGLAAYPNVTRATVADADHNFTHKAARGRLLATLTDILAP